MDLWEKSEKIETQNQPTENNYFEKSKQIIQEKTRQKTKFIMKIAEKNIKVSMTIFNLKYKLQHCEITIKKTFFALGDIWEILNYKLKFQINEIVTVNEVT